LGLVRIDIVTKEFPPEIYGGAGVHVAELSRVLSKHVDLQVRMLTCRFVLLGLPATPTIMAPP
jgi:hypothetical protein